MNAKRVFIPIAFVTCASLGIVPAVYADVPSAQVTPLEEGVAVAGGVLGTGYTMDAATRGRCHCGCRPRFLRDSLQRALTRKGSRQAGAPAGLSKGCSEARQGRTHPVIRPVGPRPCGALPRPKARRTHPVIRPVAPRPYGTSPRPKTRMYIPRPKIRYRRSSPTVHRWWLRATLYLSGVLHLLGLLRLTLHIMSDMVNRHGREAGLGEETYEY